MPAQLEIAPPSSLGIELALEGPSSKITFGSILRSIISLIWLAARASTGGAGAAAQGGNQAGETPRAAIPAGTQSLPELWEH